MRYLHLLRFAGFLSLVLLTSFVTPVTAQPVLSASEIDYPPFSIVNADGQPDGFSVELLRAALKAMGREVTFHVGPWGEVRGMLERGEIQVLPVVGRTPEREALFDFTFPYMSLHGAIVVREEAQGLRTLNDLRGRTVAVMKGDNAEEFMRRTERGIHLITTTTFEEALHGLAAGDSDAVVMQRLVALRLLQETGLKNLKVIDRPVDDFRQDFSFAVKDGDRDTLAVLNEGLALVIADGTYQRLHAKWFASMQLPAKSRLIVGGDADFPPYEYLDDRGYPTGFITELTRSIAQETGLDIEIRLGPWDEIVAALEAGKIDMIQGMFYSPERSLVFDFGTTHLLAHYVSAVRRGRMSPPETYEDLIGLRLVAQRGDVIVQELINRGLGDSLTLVESQEKALHLVLTGQQDCAVTARVPALSIIEANRWSDLKLGSRSLLERKYAYSVGKGHHALLAVLNEGLQAIQVNGEYRRIHDKWLGKYQEPPHTLWVALKYSAIVLIPLLIGLTLALLWSWSLRRQVARHISQIRESQRQLRIITDTAQDAILMMSPTGEIVFSNPATNRMFGLDPKDILGRNLHEVFVSGQYLDHNRHSIEHIKARNFPNDAPTTYQLKTFNKRGEEIDVELSLARVMLKTGLHSVGIIRDITERKLAEKKLQDSEEKHRRLFESMAQGVVYQSADGLILSANPAAGRILGLDFDRLLGKSSLDSQWRMIFEDGTPVPLVEHPAMVALRRGTTVGPLIRGVYLPRHQGCIWLSITAIPLIQPGQNRPFQVYTTFEDITARRRVEQDYQTLFREMLDGFALHEIICDNAGRPVDYRFLAVNPSFERMTGLKADVVIGKRVKELLPETEQKWIDIYGQVALGGTPVTFSEYTSSLDKYFEVTAFQPEPNRFACIFSDITERQLATKALQKKNEEMEQFVNIVSHDLKSPLVTVTTFLSILRQDLATARQEQIDVDISYIEGAAGKMDQLLEALVQYSKVGRAMEQRQILGFTEIVGDCLTSLAGAMRQRGIVAEVDESAVLLTGDPLQLGQIWQNLIENAIKYSADQPQPRITIGVRQVGEDIVFHVGDNGMGIAPEHHDRIFHLFTQLNRSSKGSGLGLALVKKIIDLYRGRIWVDSAGEGSGSCFYFTLPGADPRFE